LAEAAAAAEPAANEAGQTDDGVTADGLGTAERGQSAWPEALAAFANDNGELDHDRLAERLASMPTPPESPDGYEIAFGDDFEFVDGDDRFTDDEFLGELRSVAHQHGLPGDAVNALAQTVERRHQGQIKALQEHYTAEMERAGGQERAKERLNGALTQASQVLGEEAARTLAAGITGADALAAFETMASRLAGGTMAESGSQPANKTDDIRAQLDRVLASDEYWSSDHAVKQRADQQARELAQKLTNGR